jgi:hypothetical protein
MCRSASIAPSREELGALPAPPRQCCPHRRGVRRGLTGSTVKRATRPPWLCILCQRACRNAQARVSPNKKDDATTTAKQTGVDTLPYFLVDVLNAVPRRNSVRARRPSCAFLWRRRRMRSRCTRAIRIWSSRQMHRPNARVRVRSGVCSTDSRASPANGEAGRLGRRALWQLGDSTSP